MFDTMDTIVVFILDGNQNTVCTYMLSRHLVTRIADWTIKKKYFHACSPCSELLVQWRLYVDITVIAVREQLLPCVGQPSVLLSRIIYSVSKKSCPFVVIHYLYKFEQDLILASKRYTE